MEATVFETVSASVRLRFTEPFSVTAREGEGGRKKGAGRGRGRGRGRATEERRGKGCGGKGRAAVPTPCPEGLSLVGHGRVGRKKIADVLRGEWG
jgi:hypothetical protein